MNFLGALKANAEEGENEVRKTPASPSQAVAEDPSSGSASNSGLVAIKGQRAGGDSDEVVQRLKTIDEVARKILEKAKPNPQGIAIRLEITHFIVGLLESLIPMNKLHALIFPCGSVPVRTFLPDADLDISVLSLRKAKFHKDFGKSKQAEQASKQQQKAEEEDRQYYKTIQFIFRAIKAFEWKGSTEATRGHRVEMVKLIRARVNLITCKIDGYEVDISFQKESAMYKVILFEELDRIFSNLNSKLHMVKEYSILAKAWFTYEARAMGGNRGLLTSYALEILVISVMNMFWDEVQAPGSFLRKFFEFYANFNWKDKVLTLYGTLDKEHPERRNHLRNDLPITSSKVIRFLKGCQIPGPESVGEEDQMPMGKMSVQDPLDHSNNITHTIKENAFDRLVKVFKHGNRKIQGLLAKDCARAQCTQELFPSSHWILDQSKNIESDHYSKRFDANSPPSGDLLASGNMEVFHKYATYYNSVVSPR